ncbi:MAG: ADP-ribosylation factor-like protein [Methanoregula sp.]|nr:ADP-ribosylation factor-like protein [Methanoregula sp.]
MISTGMNSVDDMLGGGIPQGGRVLYSMEPGVNGQLFMVSSLCRALAQNLSCLVILPGTTVEAYRHDLLTMKTGFIDLSSDKIVFIDAIDRERIQKSSPGPDSAQLEWKARIAKVCGERKIDVIFAYFDLLSEEFGIECGLDILEQGDDVLKPTLFLELLNLEGEPLISQFIHDFSFDVVISIKSSFKPLPHFDYFTLVHTPGSPQPVRSVPFVTAEGRIVPYIPRIVVTGPAQSGKSTFVTSASIEGMPVDRVGLDGDLTTESMDLGMLQSKGFDITIYGTPGQPQFDLLIPGMLKHTMGVILMVDATKPQLLPQAKEMIGLLAEHSVPMVIAANKNDLPGTMEEKDIRAALGIKADIPVFFISATRKADVRHVVESLVNSITQIPY